MTDEKYLETQRALTRLAVEVQGLDLEGFLGRIARAEEAGPQAEPVLFGRGAETLAAVKELAVTGRQLLAAYEANPKAMLGLIVDAYSPEERARAGIV